MLLNTQYIVLIIAWLRPVQTGFLRSTNILLRGKTETDEIPNPHEPRPAVRSFPVRSSLVSGFFPVHRTGPRNTIRRLLCKLLEVSGCSFRPKVCVELLESQLVE